MFSFSLRNYFADRIWFGWVSSCVRILPYLFLFCFFLLPTVANAHFKLNLNIRILHIEHHSEGLDVYLRLPTPYLLANLLGPEQADGTREAAPYSQNVTVDGELMHYLDLKALEADPISLGQLAAAGHVLSVRGSNLEAAVKQVLVYTGNDQPPFSTLDEAKRAFKNEQRNYDPAPFIGDTVVDVLLTYQAGRSISSYTLASTLDPGLPGQEQTANLVLDYKDDVPSVFRVTGLLSESVEIDRSQWSAAKSFIVSGVEHILGGYDHVLFVVCLILGAMTFVSLAWRVTGFTLGHSVTLSLGFFGFTPSAVWFVPLVETGIALSIVFAAIFALNNTYRTKGRETVAFAVTVLLGLLHGLGFSFVLKEILGVTSSNIWISLLSFNVGVEIGQLLIVLLLWPVLVLIQNIKPAWVQVVRWCLALPCIAIAALWSGQRAVAFLVAWNI